MALEYAYKEKMFAFPGCHETLLGKVLPDLYPLIFKYCGHRLPTLKEGYEFKSQIGASVLRDPDGIVVDGYGTIYVSDTSRQAVHAFQRDGTWLRTFGEKGRQIQPGMFVSLAAIAIDFEENLVLSDYGSCRIQVFDTNGNFKRMFGEEEKGGLHAYFIGIDNQGNYIIPDFNLHQIKVFTPYGVLLNQFGSHGNELGELDSPVGVAVDANGTFYVCDRGNHRVQVFSPTGTPLRVFGSRGYPGSRGYREGQFDLPWGLRVAEDGKILVVDPKNGIQVFSNDGRFLLKLPYDTGSGATSHVLTPFIDQDGSIYVTDYARCQICIFG